MSSQLESAPRIAQLISLTLLTVSACATDTGTEMDASTNATDYNPCAGWDPEPYETDIEVTDLVLTSMTYDAMIAEVEEFSPEAWSELDDAGRCVAACAYAAGYARDLEPSDSKYAGTLDILDCALTIPTLEDGDGVLDCSGTRSAKLPCLGGRAPLEWRLGRGGSDELCTALDAMATMEAVSITAFTELAAQLERHAAPTALIEGCRAAARDEADHLRLLEGLGGRGPAQLPAPAAAETSLLSIALHNAVEGCVNETWAALLAGHQAQHAADADTRAAFAVIAEDEARHAQLAWELHVWLRSQLSAEELARVESRRAAALAELERVAVQQALASDANMRRQLGLPAPRRAAALARCFGPRLAAAA